MSVQHQAPSADAVALASVPCPSVTLRCGSPVSTSNDDVRLRLQWRVDDWLSSTRARKATIVRRSTALATAWCCGRSSRRSRRSAATGAQCGCRRSARQEVEELLQASSGSVPPQTPCTSHQHVTERFKECVTMTSCVDAYAHCPSTPASTVSMHPRMISQCRLAVPSVEQSA